MSLNGKNVVVIGASRGLGRVVTAALHKDGAHVLAVARTTEPLTRLAAELPGVATLALDATDADAPASVFATLRPDALILCGGAPRTHSPLHELDWTAFTGVWENDVKSSFLFCKAALTAPLAHGATVILISSGAAIGGSPISGGYAGAKRMQMFMANYAQKESDRLRLGIRFLALAPMRPMPDTEGGLAAVEGYARYLGVTPDEFVKRQDAPQTAGDVARTVAEFVSAPPADSTNIFTVSAKGVAPMT
jgi:NAD(P)-dependent dehydrogenase (short-subunit alcohol dehydrogenase family)